MRLGVMDPREMMANPTEYFPAPYYLSEAKLTISPSFFYLLIWLDTPAKIFFLIE